MLSYLVTFVAVAALGVHAAYYCPPQLQRGGHLQAFGNKCFSFHPEHERQFEEAEDFCRKDGGHLAIIRDIETQNYLYHIMHDKLRYGGEVWIGLNDKNSEGTFVWNDGSPASFTYWASGQPNNFLGIGDDFEDCVFMDMSDQGRWHDNLCHDVLLIHHRKRFICEYPAKIIPTTTTSTTTTTTLRPTSRRTTTTTTQPPPRTTRAATTTTTATTATTAKVTTAAATTAKATTAAATTAKATTAATTTAKATTAAATTRTVTSVRTEAQTTSTTTSAESGCPAFECNKDCGLVGYKFDKNDCLICQCAD